MCKKIINWYLMTDGGATKTENDDYIGGWGSVIRGGADLKESLYGSGEIGATNNNMEITAAYKGLEKIKELIEENGGYSNFPMTTIYFISDSAYVINCIKEKWYLSWKKNNWKNSKKEPVANKEEWERLVSIYELLIEEKQVNIVPFHINSHIPKSRLDEGYVKFQKKNKIEISKEGFLSLVALNEEADELATLGQKEFSELNKTEPPKEIEQKTKEPVIICCLGQYAAGKTTLEKGLAAKGVVSSAVSTTTRPMRKGEIEGVDYYFVEKEEFLKRLKRGDMIEFSYIVNTDVWYGLSKNSLQFSKPNFFTVDLVGYRQIKEYAERNGIKVISIYYNIDWRTRMKRAVDRGDALLDITHRMVYDSGRFEGVSSLVDIDLKIDSNVNQEEAQEIAWKEIKKLL